MGIFQGLDSLLENEQSARRGVLAAGAEPLLKQPLIIRAFADLAQLVEQRTRNA